MSKELTLTVDRRELATILAALRFHQDENLRDGPGTAGQAIEGIATDCGSFEPLDFDEVSRLSERMNLSGQECAHRHRQVWVLMVMDASTVIHACAYSSKLLAAKAMMSYLRDHWSYTGNDAAQAREWIGSHCRALRVEIQPVNISCCAGPEGQADGKCNWCGNAIGAEDIKWRGVSFCSESCLDECRAAQ